MSPRAATSEVALASNAPKTTVAPTRWSSRAKLWSSGRIAAIISGTRLPDHVDDDHDNRCRRHGAEHEPGCRPVQPRELRARPGLTGRDERSRPVDWLCVLDEGTEQRHRRDAPQRDRGDYPPVPRVEVDTQDGEPDPER